MGETISWQESPFYAGLTDAQQEDLCEYTRRYLSHFRGIPTEDIAMDAMIKAANGNFAVQGDDPMESRKRFLAVVARRLAANYVRDSPTRQLRRYRGDVCSLDVEAMNDIGWFRLAAAPQEEDAAITADIRNTIDGLLDDIRPRAWGVVLRLRYLEGKEYSQIAAETGLPFGSVCTHVMRGKKRLAVMLEMRGYRLEDLLPTNAALPARRLLPPADN